MPRTIFVDITYSVPSLNFDTFKKIWPMAIAMFAGTTVENLLAFCVMGENTETEGSSNCMVVGQGLAQFVSAMLGSMGGGAQLDQSIFNYKSVVSHVCQISLPDPSFSSF
jgi:MFS superfamily sulfate permease-like transporter